MPLCFWRHSFPDYESDAHDPILSEWGRKEALRAAQEIQSRVGERKLHILSSPLKRCVETAEQLGQITRIQYQEDAALRLKDSWESTTDFRDRLERLLPQLKKLTESECTVLCTHSDVLAHYLIAFGGPRMEIEKANFFWVADGRVKEVNPV